MAHDRLLSRTVSVELQQNEVSMSVHTLWAVLGALKMTDMKLQDMKMADQIAGHENAGHEIARHLRQTCQRRSQIKILC